MKHLNNRSTVHTFGGGATELVLAYNALLKRARVTFVNNTANEMWASKGNTAGLDVGILIPANGGVLIDEPLLIDGYTYMYQGEWYVYCAGAVDLSIDEEMI